MFEMKRFLQGLLCFRNLNEERVHMGFESKDYSHGFSLIIHRNGLFSSPLSPLSTLLLPFLIRSISF